MVLYLYLISTGDKTKLLIGDYPHLRFCFVFCGSIVQGGQKCTLYAQHHTKMVITTASTSSPLIHLKRLTPRWRKKLTTLSITIRLLMRRYGILMKRKQGLTLFQIIVMTSGRLLKNNLPVVKKVYSYRFNLFEWAFLILYIPNFNCSIFQNFILINFT